MSLIRPDEAFRSVSDVGENGKKVKNRHVWVDKGCRKVELPARQGAAAELLML